MIDFIRRNKVFTFCLTICLIVIVGLSTLIVLKENNMNENILVLPPLLNQPVEKDPEIHMFKGEFNEENNTVFLTWDYELNRHSFQKVELYHDETMIQTYYDERQCEVSIFEYELSTGSNNFELVLYYDNGMAVTKEANVFIEYIFDIVINRQLIQNNLGQGYLVTIDYAYNSNTPAGYPELSVKTNYSSYWEWKQLGIERQTYVNNYQGVKMYYLISLDQIPNQEISWELNFKFNSVGIRKETSFVENPTELEANTNEMIIKK